MDPEKHIQHDKDPEKVSHTPADRKDSVFEHVPAGERRLSLEGRRISVVDDIFGEIKEGGPNYRNVGWLGTSVLMIKTQIGLGVLSIPQVLDTLGMGPGLVVLIAIGIITTWSNYMIGVFKKNHPTVYSIDDVGFLLFGRWGREFFYVAFLLFWIFVAGAGMLGISISLNAMSAHGTCTAVFVVVAAVIAFSLGSIQTLHQVSWLAWVGASSIVIAIFTLTIAVGVQDKPADAPPGPFHSDWKATNDPSFTSAISACSSIVFAWAGTPAFFQIASEMREPHKYTRSLILCQSVMAVVYIVIGVVVYYYCGSYVASPALGSAGRLLKKVCSGLAFPGLCVSTLLFVHIAAKYIFVRMLRGTYHLTDPTFRHWATWIGCTFTITLISYIIASAIPVFGGLVSLIGALLGTLLSFQPFGAMWLYDNWQSKRSFRWYLMVVWSVFVIVSGFFLMIAGTYGSVVDIKDAYDANGGTSPWSCADNSNSSRVARPDLAPVDIFGHWDVGIDGRKGASMDMVAEVVTGCCIESH